MRQRRRDERLGREGDEADAVLGRAARSRKRRTASCAAPSRVGLTSSADIEPETSTTSAIDACSLATDICTSGRASAATAHVSASSASSGGQQRAPVRLAGRDAAPAPRCSCSGRHSARAAARSRGSASTASGTISSASSARGHSILTSRTPPAPAPRRARRPARPRRVALTSTAPPRTHAHDADGRELRARRHARGVEADAVACCRAGAHPGGSASVARASRPSWTASVATRTVIGLPGATSSARTNAVGVRGAPPPPPGMQPMNGRKLVGRLRAARVGALEDERPRRRDARVDGAADTSRELDGDGRLAGPRVDAADDALRADELPCRRRGPGAPGAGITTHGPATGMQTLRPLHSPAACPAGHADAATQRDERRPLRRRGITAPA